MANQLFDQATADQLMQRGFLTQEQYDAMFNPAATMPAEEPDMGGITVNLDNPVQEPAVPFYQPYEQLAKTLGAGEQQGGMAAKILPPEQMPVAAEPADTMPSAGASPYDVMQQGLALQAGAAQQKAADDIAALQQIEVAQKKAEADQLAGIQDAQKRADDALLKYEEGASQLKSFSIDPGRYWKNQSVADKVGIGIALILGAFGSGQTNRAAEIINDAIAQDVNAQKADFEAKRQAVSEQKNAYALFYKVYNDKNMALSAAKLDALNKAKLQLDINASKYAGAAATAEYAQASAKLAAEIAKQKQELAGLAQLESDPLAAGLTKEQREAYVPKLNNKIPHGLMVFGTNEEKKQTRTALVEAADAVDAIDSLRRIAATNLKTISPSERAKAQTNVQVLIGKLRIPLTGPGVLTDAEQERLLKIIPNPTDVFQLSDVTQARLNELEARLVNGAQNKARAIGLQTSKSRGEKVGFRPGG